MPFQKKKTVKKSAKKKNEHCGRQIPTEKYSKNNVSMLFSFKVKHVM